MPDIRELLARLKVADPIAYEDIRRRCIDYFDAVMTLYSKEKSFQENIDDTIQGCIQRAIAARRWIYQQGHNTKEDVFFWSYIWIGDKNWLGEGDSPAMALLAAYLKAVEA